MMNYVEENSGRMINYDEENSDEAQPNWQSACAKENSVEAADISHEDSFSSTIRRNSCPSKHQDQLADSIMSFIAVQELLGKEVQMFSKIGKETTSLSTILFTDPRAGENMGKLNPSKSSEEEAELENLFRQKIEAEVECLTLANSIGDLKVPYGDQANLFKEQTAVALKRRQMLKEFAELETKNLESKKNSEDNLGTEEATMVRRKACKAASCSFVQLVLLLLAVPQFISLLLSDSKMVVPT